MFEIKICPIKEFYAISEEADLKNCAAILASSYDFRAEKLMNVGKFLLLSFDDDENSFSRKFAARIKEFILGLSRDCDTVFCCCDYGESRSAAIACALMRFLGQNEMKIWENPKYHPNGFVYSLLCEELGCGVSEDELKINEEKSRSAFKNKKA